MKNNVLRFTDRLSDIMPGQLNCHRDTVLIIICRNGWMRLQMGEQLYELHGCEMIVCRPELVISHYEESADCRCLTAIADPLALNELVFSCLRNSSNWVGKMHYILLHPHLMLSERQQRLLDAFHEIFLIYTESEPTPYAYQIQHTFAQAAVYEILSWLDTEIGHCEPARAGVISERSMNVFRRFMSLLESKRGTERSVQWYATQLSITPKYLTHICKLVINKTALDLITDITCHEIRQELTSGDDSIKEIAFRMNFPNLTFFSKYTRQHLGATPSEIRKRK